VRALLNRGAAGKDCGATPVIERLDEMSIKWNENPRFWRGRGRMAFPRFEAWRSDEYAEGRWCLDMFERPFARPITVRRLPSLEAAKEFAEGLLAEFVHTPDGDLPVTADRDEEQTYIPAPAGMQPQFG